MAMRAFALMAATVAASVLPGVSGVVTAGFTATGGYVVHGDTGNILLQSSSSPCGVHVDGQWCRCANDNVGQRKATPSASCTLQVAGRTSGTGIDAIGEFNRTEIQWSDGARVVLITAIRSYTRSKVRPPRGPEVNSRHHHPRHHPPPSTG